MTPARSLFIVVVALTLSCVVQGKKKPALVNGGQQCRIHEKGKVVTFSGTKVSIRLPCKYQATSFMCQGYRISVAPGQNFDSKGRYFTDTMWVSLAREGTPFYWKGRISNKVAQKYFNDTTRKPFNTKNDYLAGAPFTLQMFGDVASYSVTLKASDADFRVVFFPYDESDEIRRKNNGVEIWCPNPVFTEESSYPTSICANSTNRIEIKNRRSDLGLSSRFATTIYDILDSSIRQTKPQCETAARVFKNCNGDQRTALDECAVMIYNKRVLKCLMKGRFDPMNVFVYCLKFKCKNDADSCVLLREALDDCTSVSFLSPRYCPNDGNRI